MAHSARRFFAYCTLSVLLPVILCFGGRAAAQQPAEAADDMDFADELPRIAPVEPEAALETFITQSGFHMELVAAEPLVADPVAMSFDEDGRLYVAEMRGYSEQPDEFLSRISLLEDTDRDGRFDKSTVFADRLSWPTAVVTYGGGVFIGDAPSIWYLKDTDGDGEADVRHEVFTGFGKSNVQGLFNTFTWGLDNRIHGATSSSGGEVRPADQADAPPLALSGRDFAFDPNTLEMRPTSGGGQHGMSFDSWGRKFVCSNSDHIQQVMFEDRYLARNPFLSAPGSRASIAADGPQAEVFRASPVEPWRIVRTRLRVAGTVPGPIEGGGRAAGYFTGATGVTIYRGDAWPRDLWGTAVVGDVGSNLVHRKRIDDSGIQFVAHRMDEKSELVASRDIWFRPAQFANGPDGALYIADVYREVIEHPLSLPPVIKRHLDLTSGRDRGRIYRLVPDGFRQPKVPRLSVASTAKLVKLLAHSNGWHRETAARLLYERQDQTAAPLLERQIVESKSPLGRIHSMYALLGLKALEAQPVLAALDDSHPRVREHAVRLSEHVAADAPAVRDRLYALAGDDDPHVRYQVAFTLGELDGDERKKALARIALSDAADPWCRLAIQSSLVDGAGDVLAMLLADEGFRASDAARELLASLARQAGISGRQNDVAAVYKGIETLPDAEEAVAQVLVRGLSEGLAQGASPLRDSLASGSAGKAGEILAQLLASAGNVAADEEKPLAQRVEAIHTLGLGNFDGGGPLLAELIDQRQAQEVQVAALSALSHFDDRRVADSILAAWPAMGPRMRIQAAEALFGRAQRLPALLDAIESGAVNAGDIDPSRLKLLAVHADSQIRTRAEKLVETLGVGRRQDVVQAYRGALEMPGDVDRGKLVFKKICAACHRAEGVGYEIGPNLATVQNRGAESILVNVLDPSREVNPQFVNYIVETDDGRSITGMVAAETATSVTLKRAENATDTVLRINIDQMQSTGLSIMPEGVEKDLDIQAMADLIAYLLTLN